MARRRNRGGGSAGAQSPVATKTGDSFQNLVARVGLGTNNQNSASEYGFSPVSRNRVQLEFVYRSSWIAGQAVDTVAQDMTREWVEIKGDVDPNNIEKLNKATTRLKLRNAITDAIKWARLYGGCLAVLMIDGQKPETPLKLDTISEGQFKGLLVLDRWVVQPSLTELIEELGPDIGKPKFYDVIADAQAMVKMRIHHSRVVRLEGVDLPYWQRIAENGWGQSVLERLWDRLIPYDSTTAGAAQLVYKAHLRTYKVDGLREIIAVGGKAFEGLVKQIEMIRTFQSNEGITLMDGKDEFEAHQYTFSGLSDLMMQFGQQISGALGIPLVRLFGQSPAGLSSTGESDIRNYYDNIAQEQEATLRDGLLKVYGALYRSELGEEPPENFDIEFRPLWQLSDKEKADMAQTVTTAVTGAYEAQIIDRSTALKELRQSAQVTGVFTNITDEDITEAENEPPPDMSELGLGGPDDENPNAGSETAENAEPGKAGGEALQQAA
jgi:uncharacterized protein